MPAYLRRRDGRQRPIVGHLGRIRLGPPRVCGQDPHGAQQKQTAGRKATIHGANHDVASDERQREIRFDHGVRDLVGQRRRHVVAKDGHVDLGHARITVRKKIIRKNANPKQIMKIMFFVLNSQKQKVGKWRAERESGKLQRTDSSRPNTASSSARKRPPVRSAR